MEHVQRRGGRYVWRSRVPSDLVALVNRKEITKSLDTADPRVARERAARLHVRVIDFWTEARAVTKSGKTADQATADDELAGKTLAERIQARLAKLLNTLDDAQMDARAGQGGRPTMIQVRDAATRDDAIEDVKAALPYLVAAVATAEAEASETAETEAIARELGPDGVKRLERLFRRRGGQVSFTPTPTVISFLESAYINEQQLREDQSRHVENYIRLFARIAGDRPMAEYRRLDILNWVRALEKLKYSIGKSPKDSSKPIAQLIKESCGKRTLGRTTIEKHITHLKAFFITAHEHQKWCGKEDVESLFNKIRLSRDVPEVQDRIPWSIQQLSELLATPVWVGTRSRREDMSRRHEAGPQVHRDPHWWLPIVALFTGARLEELAQLHHDDLKRDQYSIPFLALKTTDLRKQKAEKEKGHSKPEAQRLKNKHSFRAVPVHPFLVKIGFLDLFQSDRPGTRIWPELKPHGRPPSWGAEYTQDFTKYRRECSIYEEMRDFHSFRHTFITWMRTGADADPLTVAAIVGHTPPDPRLRQAMQTDDYTHYSVAARSKAIDKLDYAAYGLDLAILERTAAVCGPRGSCRVEDLRRAMSEAAG